MTRAKSPCAALAVIITSLCCTLAIAQTRESVDVLVIGAGLAGLKAATDAKAFSSNVVVLEARSRPYGRVATVQPTGWAKPVEAGAQWFHGEVSDTSSGKYNDAYAYALANGAAITSVGNGEDSLTFYNGDSASNAQEKDWDALYDAWYANLPTYRAGVGSEAVQQTKPLSDAINAYITANGWGPNSLKKRGFLSRVDSNIVQEYAGSTSKLNLKWWDMDSNMGPTDGIAPKGLQLAFKPLVDALGSAIRLNHNVTSITWPSGTSKKGINVTAIDTSTGTTKLFTARYVISTLPLGVLQKRRASIFNGAGGGALTSAMTNALDKLGMGVYNKVVLNFGTNRWWYGTNSGTYDCHWIERLVPTTPNASQPLEWYDLSKDIAGWNTLVAFYAGDAAASVEASGKTDAQIKNDVMATLRDMFANTGKTVPAQPTRFLVTRWNSDPYTFGSYSYVGVGATDNVRFDACEPQANNQLFFAGEHCNNKFPSTMQGAWRAGANATAVLKKGYTAPRAHRRFG